MNEKPVCGICGEPMPGGETMFKYHGYSGPCPKPPLPTKDRENLIDKLMEWRAFHDMPEESYRLTLADVDIAIAALDWKEPPIELSRKKP